MSGWACKEHGSDQHDVFINYRVAADQVLAEKLFLKVERLKQPSGQNVRAFLDKMCLVPGQDWKEGFLNGLKSASLFVALVSEGALKNIAKADEKADNVLTEYELALDRAARGEMAILPILVGAYVTVDGDKLLKPFSYSKVGPWPNAPHKAGGRNVSETMAALAALQGVKLDPEAPDACLPEIQRALGEFYRMHPEASARKPPVAASAAGKGVDLVAQAEAREDDIRAMFRMADTDGDGKLDLEELGTLLGRLGLDDGDAEDAMEALDDNKDGTISFEEFKRHYNDLMGAVARKVEENIDEIREMFDAADTNHDGQLDFKEVKKLLKLVELPLDDDEVRDMIKQLDSDGDGLISFEEFKKKIHLIQLAKSLHDANS